jgi:hypothetical protein
MKALAGLLGFFQLVALSSAAHAEMFAWVQVGYDNQLSARAIVETRRCPEFVADGKSLENVSVRSNPGTHLKGVKEPDEELEFPTISPIFNVTVCEAKVPADTASLTVVQKRSERPPVELKLSLPPREIRRIVVFGDTGCRIKIDYKNPDKAELQDCRDRDAWPYAKIVKHAANLEPKPDLVVHVGDYHYREQECPAARNCEGPWGEGYDVWRDDFFKPSQPLLERATWIMVRGNHEDCGRAWEGWFRFLDPGPLPDQCQKFTRSLFFKRDNLSFAVIDNASAENPKKDDARGREDVVDELRKHFRDIPTDVPTWLLSHRPFGALRYDPEAGYKSDNDIQQEAIGKNLPATIRMIISGHIHIFEALSFGNSQPPQLVVGTGGDNLESIPPQQSMGVKINGANVEHALIVPRFGYMVWDKEGPVWSGGFFDDDGQLLAHCALMRRDLTCRGMKE